ncbi:unnamed protein product [Rhizophagus irregularis]|nr:unnamed protein product [Rhizophagus irregularis]
MRGKMKSKNNIMFYFMKRLRWRKTGGSRNLKYTPETRMIMRIQSSLLYSIITRNMQTYITIGSRGLLYMETLCNLRKKEDLFNTPFAHASLS